MNMEDLTNPFVVLGLDSRASEQEVKSAFAALAKMYHPDRFARSSSSIRHDAELRMMEINDAYRRAREYCRTRKPRDYRVAKAHKSKRLRKIRHKLLVFELSAFLLLAVSVFVYQVR
jgi:hypothetical protein